MTGAARFVLWHLPEWPALERCALLPEADGFRLTGTVLVRSEGAAAEIRYEVACGGDGLTRAARIEVERGPERRLLDLRVDGERRWWLGAEEIPEARGVSDVDLGFSPSTNTLPIRRLALGIGESAPVTAAWIRFPDFTVLPLRQRYTRLAERRYRYESRGGEFAAELEVDEVGLVVRYGQLWRRIAG